MQGAVPLQPLAPYYLRGWAVAWLSGSQLNMYIRYLPYLNFNLSINELSNRRITTMGWPSETFPEIEQFIIEKLQYSYPFMSIEAVRDGCEGWSGVG